MRFWAIISAIVASAVTFASIVPNKHARNSIVSFDSSNAAPTKCPVCDEFWIYGHGHYNHYGAFRVGFTFFDTSEQPPSSGRADCEAEPFWAPLNIDVSGNRIGARCDGCESGILRGESINQLEVNYYGAPGGHWTLYKDRHWGIFDLDDNHIGLCEPQPDPSFYWCGEYFRQFDVGSLLFWCRLHQTV